MSPASHQYWLQAFSPDSPTTLRISGRMPFPRNVLSFALKTHATAYYCAVTALKILEIYSGLGIPAVQSKQIQRG